MRLRWTTYIMALLLGSSPSAYSLELKDKAFQTDGAGQVVFSHSNHLKKKNAKSANVSCKSCHNSKLQKKVQYTMAEMGQGKSCGICHNGTKAFALGNCTSCHKVREISYKVKETGPTIFSHASHLKTMHCKSCHNSIFNAGPNKRIGMAGMEKGKSCGACHNGKQSFAISQCTKCHPVKNKKFPVRGAGEVMFSHDFHLGAYGCGDCHTSLYRPDAGNKAVTMKGMEAGKSCGACHDSKTAFSVRENCDKCHKV